jgi:hypothetical protein
MIDRRMALGGLAAALALPGWARAGEGVDAVAWRAALFAFSIGTMVRTMLAAPARNRLAHRRTLSDHSNRGVTMPNNDTLYSSCWLNLPPGAYADVDVPANAGRYVSAAIMGMDSDVIKLESSAGRARSNGWLRIVGPGWRGTVPEDRRLIRLHGADAWLLIRTAVDGPHDLAAAQAVQAQVAMTLGGAVESTQQAPAPLADPAEQLRAQLNRILARTAQGAPLARRARHYRRFGIGASLEPTAPDEAAWRTAVAALDARRIGDITQYGRMVNGWHWPDGRIAQYGDDERFRAAVALSGLGALPEREAIYLTAMRDAGGAPLAPGRAYRIDFSTPPPVEAFWSLSAYQAEPDGRFFFTENPLRRYAVGSATPRLRHGGTVIASPRRPSDDAAVWLPVVDGPFRLVLRAYLPRATMLGGRWRPPAIVNLFNCPNSDNSGVAGFQVPICSSI